MSYSSLHRFFQAGTGILTVYKWGCGSREIIEQGWKQRLHETSDFDTMKR